MKNLWPKKDLLVLLYHSVPKSFMEIWCIRSRTLRNLIPTNLSPWMLGMWIYLKTLSTSDSKRKEFTVASPVSKEMPGFIKITFKNSVTT